MIVDDVPMDQLRYQVAQMEAFISLVKKGIGFVAGTLAVQTVGIVWWAATLSANVVSLNLSVGGLQGKTEAMLALKRLDERIEEDRQRMAILEERVLNNRSLFDGAVRRLK